jgi:[ribosomal protein S18]-alanine N-acetyltransferase
VSAAERTLPQGLDFRILTLSDLPAIMRIERESFTTPWRELTFQGLLLRADTDLIGSLQGGELVGYAVAWTVEDQAEIGNVAVAPAQRGRGLGRLLVEKILGMVVGRGARQCFLEVRESNLGARRLYEQANFQVVGRRRNYYSKPTEDALVMRCDLL